MNSGRSEAKDHCGGLRERTGRAGEDGEGMGEGLSYRTSCHVQLNCPGTICGFRGESRSATQDKAGQRLQTHCSQNVTRFPF